jgi:post-segregation antitoxin (ccd killing protein)
MARRNISIPKELDEQARTARLNVSALAQRAVADELDRRRRMAALDQWLDALDDTHGAPSDEHIEEARVWVASATRPADVTATAKVSVKAVERKQPRPRARVRRAAG